MSAKLSKTLAIVCALALLTVGVSYASTFIAQNDGPNWNDAGDVYNFGVCSDTAFGETVCVQYTTDGTDIATPGPTGEGVKAACGFINDTTCTFYWGCSISETALATIKYRFYVVNQAAGGDCNAAASFYGMATAQATFDTGPNAITLRQLAASPAGATALPLVLGLGLIAVGSGALWLRRRS